MYKINCLKIGQRIAIVILIMVTLFCQTSLAGEAPTVSTDKDAYSYGEIIKVNFSNAPGNDRDWICIIPVGSPDTDSGDYKSLPKGLVQGFLTFAPPAPGKYEARAYYDYGRKGYAVSGRYVFSVGNDPNSERNLLLEMERMARKINPDNSLEVDLTAGNGLVYIFRESWSMSEDIDVQIMANGNPIVLMKKSDYFLFSVPEGKVNFTTGDTFFKAGMEKIKADRFEFVRPGKAIINVKSGYVYYLKLKVFPTGTSSSLEIMPHQEGAGLINSYKLTQVK